MLLNKVHAFSQTKPCARQLVVDHWIAGRIGTMGIPTADDRANISAKQGFPTF